MSSSHADTGICRTLTENDIYAEKRFVWGFLEALNAGYARKAAQFFWDNNLSRRIGNPSLKAHSKSPYLRLSELMREIHAKSPDCWKNKVVEKGVQLWLCMENKLSQETEDLDKQGRQKPTIKLYQKLGKICQEAVAELATDSELRIRKHQEMEDESDHEAIERPVTDSALPIRKQQGKRGSLEISGKPFQKKDESGHEAVERQVTDSALPMRTQHEKLGSLETRGMVQEAVAKLETDSALQIRKQQGPHSTTQATSKRLTPVGTTSKCKIQDDDADPLYIIIDGKEYYNNGRKKGYLLILNSRENREGTEVDVANIMKFFKDKLRFEVDDPRSNECADLSTESLIKYLEEAQNKLSSASEYYCFICIILYHGNEKGIATSNGIKSVEDIQKMFSNDKVPHFAGKPKLFFIQACRGPNYTGYVPVRNKTDAILEDDADKIIKVPYEADILVAYATSPGNVAFREGDIGSWFISEMIEEFEKNYVRDHVEEMLITVRQRVASIYAKEENSMQMPCVQSTLTRRIKFN